MAKTAKTRKLALPNLMNRAPATVQFAIGFGQAHARDLQDFQASSSPDPCGLEGNRNILQPQSVAFRDPSAPPPKDAPKGLLLPRGPEHAPDFGVTC